MKIFEKKFFQKFSYTKSQLEEFLQTARRDLNIAKKSDIPEVTFRFSYDALVKLGIYLIAGSGHKIRSIPGHHVKIIETLAELLKDTEIVSIADEMRRKRNKDLYLGGCLLTEKDCQTYLKFIESLFNKSRM